MNYHELSSIDKGNQLLIQKQYKEYNYINAATKLQCIFACFFYTVYGSIAIYLYKIKAKEFFKKS